MDLDLKAWCNGFKKGSQAGLSEGHISLSQTLNRLGDKLFPPAERGTSFRNLNGVYMKLMNFRRLDPNYIKEGKKGLSRGAKADELVWNEFSQHPTRCREVAEAIIGSLEDSDTDMGFADIYRGRC